MPAHRVLLTCFGSYGDVNPYVGLALALRARGHEPVVATSAFYREYVEREGIAFHPVRPDVDPDDRALVARIMDPARGTEFLLRELILPALGESWADLDAAARGADLLVSHPVTFAAPLVAEERGLPWVSSVLAPMSFFSPHELPVFAPLPRLRHLARVPGVAPLLVRIVRAVSRPWTRPVRALRAERGLPPSGDALFEGQHSPALVLALFSRVLGAPQPDWPARVRVTGAIPYNGPTGGAVPSALVRFLDAGPAPLVFTLGSSAVAAAGDFYVESAAAARRLGMRAVLLTGRHAENRARGAAGDDLLLVEHAPHRELLPRAAAVVHQGGIGTLHQALRAGRPQLVVPWAHDQPDNAHRAARLGVARVLYPRDYRAARVDRALRAVLEPPVVARAAAVAETVRAEDGAAAACDAIQACLAGGALR